MSRFSQTLTLLLIWIWGSSLFGFHEIPRHVHSQAEAGVAPKSGTPEELHNILSTQQLVPALRSARAYIRIAPNGKFLLVQDPTGIYVLSRDPLKLESYLRIPEAVPAQFSFDSREIVVVTQEFALGRFPLENLQRPETMRLPVSSSGCLQAQLSPGGLWLACYTPQLDLEVIELSTGKVVFHEPLETFGENSAHNFAVPLDIDSCFAQPMGFELMGELPPMVGPRMFRLSMSFSPDASEFIAGRRETGGFALDLATKRRLNPTKAVRERFGDSMSLLEGGRVIVSGAGKEHGGIMVPVGVGAPLLQVPFAGNFVVAASNPRYLLFRDPIWRGEHLFDAKENRVLAIPGNLSADMFQDELFLYLDTGKLVRLRLGDLKELDSAWLPIGPLPYLRGAEVSPQIDSLMIAVDGAGAQYDLSSGNRTAELPQFAGAYSNDSRVLALLPRSQVTPATMVALGQSSETTVPAWPRPASQGDHFFPGGNVVWEYQRLPIPLYRNSFSPITPVPFEIRALDPSTGKLLWQRAFGEEAPVPYFDPQGDRLVLGWLAQSPGANRIIKNHQLAVLWGKKPKTHPQDSLFEVRDAQTGKSLGGVLVQEGIGPQSFDSAFSEGDVLVLWKDSERVFLYSLRDGKLKGRMYGSHPAASATTNLVAVDRGSGLLEIFDGKTGAKLDEERFSQNIAYMHFSADGKRLLVLTEYQRVYIVDVSRPGSPRTSSGH
ncbi:MAG TPA: hypothetical protein VLV88_08165 [Terriglobales bacterium]|nr:hypothetical protein [Terriglobales bacterium]